MTVSEILRPPQPLNLRKRFALASLLVISAIAIVLGLVLSNVLTERMLQREGEVTGAFMQNLLTTDRSAEFLANPADPELRQRFLRSMEHIVAMSDTVRSNAYGLDKSVLWSTNKSLVGKRFDDNPELDTALTGRLEVHAEDVNLEEVFHDRKTEHVGMSTQDGFFVETYIPILARDSDRVLGVMEVYKRPTQLNAAIHRGLQQLWIACFLCAIGLFVTLYWIVAHADKTLRDQQLRLTEAQSLASAVELASAVAHNLRNPLASIRSAAELMNGGHLDEDEISEVSEEVIDAVDRADRWITELVHVSQAPQLQPEAVDLGPLVDTCLLEMAPEMNRRHIVWNVDSTTALQVDAHPATLRQILLSIMANAIEAMPGGGHLDISWCSTPTLAGIRLSDSGTGISDEVQQRLFRPFFTTKGGGLGIGLALVKRMVEQWQGHLTLAPAGAKGTVVEILLPRSAPCLTQPA